jgi:CRISPR/Cas system CSM-associated protein Csm3 (group 7 of RAMP superfamily)
MARKIRTRLKIKGSLVANSPLHIGGNDGSALVDLALAVNGQGAYYIPGTSLAGALRAWMASEGALTNLVEDLWGNQEKSGKEKLGHASYILIEDAPINKDVKSKDVKTEIREDTPINKGVKTEIRDGVGIDRYYGTAAEQVKFDRAILPKGTEIPLVMTVEHADKSPIDWETRKGAVVALLKALEGQEIRLGAAKTRGLGRVQLKNPTILEQDLCSAEGMLGALRNQGTSLSLGALAEKVCVPPARPKLTVAIDWEPVGPLMVKAEADGIAVDTLPLVSAVGDHLTFVLPGSAIKGALRSQAERIIRTLQAVSLEPDRKFNDQLQAVPLIQEVFGSAARLKPGSNPQKKEQHGRLGALAVDDCYAKLAIQPEQWSQIESAANERELRQRLNAAQLHQTQQAFHVAVDRWTGGAADGFLYSTLEPMGVTWEPIGLTLDLNWLNRTASDTTAIASIALVLLLLRDLAAGRIPLGYGVNRGMGAIQINHIQIQGYGLEDLNNSLQPLTQQSLAAGQLSALSGGCLETLNEAWKNWVHQHLQGGETP